MAKIQKLFPISFNIHNLNKNTVLRPILLKIGRNRKHLLRYRHSIHLITLYICTLLSTYSHFLYRYGNPWCSTKTDRNNMHINGFQGDCTVENCPFANKKQDIPDFLEKTTEPSSLPPLRPNSAVLEGRYYVYLCLNQTVSFYVSSQ